MMDDDDVLLFFVFCKTFANQFQMDKQSFSCRTQICVTSLLGSPRVATSKIAI